METEFQDCLIAVLEASITKHGPDKPLTLSHFLNIVKMARDIKNMKDDDNSNFLEEIRNECLTDRHRYGNS